MQVCTSSQTTTPTPHYSDKKNNERYQWRHDLNRKLPGLQRFFLLVFLLSHQIHQWFSVAGHPIQDVRMNPVGDPAADGHLEAILGLFLRLRSG